MKLKMFSEGKARFFAPEVEKPEEGEVFFNPRAEFSRDLSVVAIQTFQRKFKEKLNISDALAATGVRGLRYAKEISGIKSVTLNDKNPMATKLIKKNIALNKLKKCVVEWSDANVLLSKKRYNVIDLDPFGSPVYFFDSASRSIFWKGLLCVTATDTAPLCGTYPMACLRKYGVKSIKTEYYNELGLRILMSSLMTSLARYEKAFVPLLSIQKDYYFRVFGSIERGAGKVDAMMKNFGYVMRCPCGNRIFGDLASECSCGKRFKVCGPIYLGNLNDKKFLTETLKDFRKRKFGQAEFLEKLSKELDVPFYYDVHNLSSILKIKSPKMEQVIKGLKKAGYKASRTVFCYTGIKTDCGFEKMKRIVKKAK